VTVEDAILGFNRGSSAITLALFADERSVLRLRSGAIERVGAAHLRYHVTASVPLGSSREMTRCLQLRTGGHAGNVAARGPVPRGVDREGDLYGV
jgi:hypothetical protein